MAVVDIDKGADLDPGVLASTLAPVGAMPEVLSAVPTVLLGRQRESRFLRSRLG